MSNIWLISDTHFNHNQPFLYEPRGFTNVKDIYALQECYGYIGFTSFYINGDSISVIDSQLYEFNYVKCIKSAINDNKEQAIFCYYNSTKQPTFFIYNVYEDTIYFDDYNYSCKPKYYSLRIEYFKEKDDFIFSCLKDSGGIITVIFDEDFYLKAELIDKDIICDNNYGYSLIYSKNVEKY